MSLLVQDQHDRTAYEQSGTNLCNLATNPIYAQMVYFNSKYDLGFIGELLS
jgi:hypothetical protein